MHYKISKCAVIVASLMASSVVLAGSLKLKSTDTDYHDDVESYCSILSQINRYTPVDGAGVRGTLGLNIGAGVSSSPISSSSTLLDDQANSMVDDSLEGDRLTMSKVYLLSGVIWPVDIGVVAGASTEHHLTQAGAHIQWSPIQIHRWPSLALRGSYSKIFGLRSSEFSSTTLDLVGSYGFLRYFNAYLVTGLSRHQAKIDIDSEDDSSYLISESVPSGSFNKTWIDNSTSVGLKIAIYPPFMSIAAEAQQHHKDEMSYAAKFSVGM